MPLTSPAVPGEPLIYTLTYGNIGQTTESDLELGMDIPEGVQFLSASGGGSFDGNRVTWDIDLLGSGGGI